MNFRENFKRPLTLPPPPHFHYIAFPPENPCLKPCIKVQISTIQFWIENDPPLGSFPKILPFWYHYPALILEEEQKAHEFNFILKRLFVHRDHFMMCMVLNDTNKLWRFYFCFRFTDLFYPVPAALLVVLVRKIAERWDMQTKRDFQN